MAGSKEKYNRLINEKSPYLLQHACNLVEWYPWTEEAFLVAKEANKPIFLSIGYSTCHWCHVMAHESFEDIEVAKLLNDSFVCIKVDREERPDIDQVYMNVCQLITGKGGWPLTIIMTPQKKPFFAANYIPKEDKFGIKGLLSLIPEITNLWENNKNELEKSAQEITITLQKLSKQNRGKNLDVNILDLTYNQLLSSFDEQYGGFGHKPKFPTPHNLLFLLRYWKRTGNTYSLKMVDLTLEHMRMGGIYDHVGFGFHRYSTDREWIVPHFEKMLYDQALLAITYTEAYQATKKHLFRQTAQEILSYVHRDMTDPEGGFYSAVDADSEGVEGKFYLWDNAELTQILSSDEFELISKIYNIKEEGNFHTEPCIGSKQNIFYQSHPLNDYCRIFHMNEDDIIKNIEAIRMKLYIHRNNRIHPEIDDKILTDWNGLIIAALSKAAQVFGKNSYITLAEKTQGFIEKNMRQSDGGVFHRYRNGEAKILGYADDYAFLIWGLIELYEATFKPKYIQFALELNKYLLGHFWDNNNGGLFFISDTNEELPARMKDIYDGAVPSANSITMYNLIRLARMTGDGHLEQKAKQIGQSFSKNISKIPSGYTQAMVSLDFVFGPSYEIVIVGRKENVDAGKMLQEINSMYLPNKVVIFKRTDGLDQDIVRLAPFIKDYVQIDNQATAYICKNQLCESPATEIEKIKQILRS